MSNPFHKSLKQFRGRHVRVVSNDGHVHRGWVERLHHHDRHVVLRDATRVESDQDVDVGAVMIAHADTIEIREDTARIKDVDLDLLDPSPFAVREFELAANRQYVDDVRDQGFVGSYPVARRRDDGRLELVEGHKRIWACRQAGLDSHPVEIVHLGDWRATQRFVADHLPDERYVNDDGTTSNGWYDTADIEAAIEALDDEWGYRMLNLERVAYNVDRLDLAVDDAVDDDQDDAETTEVDSDAEDLASESTEVADDVSEPDTPNDGESSLDHTSPEDLQEAYDEADGVIKTAAKRFDVTYETVYRWMIDLGVHEPNTGSNRENLDADGPHAVGERLDEDDLDEDAEPESDDVDELPDDVTVDEIQTAADDHDTLAEVAAALDIPSPRMRTLLVQAGVYSQVRDVTKGHPNRTSTDGGPR